MRQNLAFANPAGCGWPPAAGVWIRADCVNVCNEILAQDAAGPAARP